MNTEIITINDIDPENLEAVNLFETAMGEDDSEPTPEEIGLYIDEACDKLNESIGDFLQFGSVADLLEVIAAYLNAVDEDDATLDDGLSKN